ncbi:hypothetical protein niasHT_039624 [Heterodera trifolii]|uniref:Uncharacterized protein n=1 Tax=Heterodera trifolii TaxID=157864 RepID=A0ABD2IJ93_9BILA
MFPAKYKAFRLENKVAVITAATNGIGLAIAERLGHEGARVVVSSRDEDNVKRAIDRLVSSGLKRSDLAGCTCHVSNSDDRSRLLKLTIQRFGNVHILVNNAGINPIFGDLLDVDESAWDKLFDVNVKAGFMLAKLFAPEIERSGGGSIVFNSSIGAYRSPQGIAAYGITKTALLGLTRALAESLAPKGIRVNAIAPGIIKTKMSKALWEGIDERKSAEAIGTLLGRLGMPEECAALVAFLCSSDASYITGETVPVAGGAYSRL